MIMNSVTHNIAVTTINRQKKVKNKIIKGRIKKVMKNPTNKSLKIQHSIRLQILEQNYGNKPQSYYSSNQLLDSLIPFITFSNLTQTGSTQSQYSNSPEYYTTPIFVQKGVHKHSPNKPNSDLKAFTQKNDIRLQVQTQIKMQSLFIRQKQLVVFTKYSTYLCIYQFP